MCPERPLVLTECRQNRSSGTFHVCRMETCKIPVTDCQLALEEGTWDGSRRSYGWREKWVVAVGQAWRARHVSNDLQD